MPLGFQRLGSPIACEVRGVDLSRPLADATFAAIYDAFVAHSVLVFRHQTLEPEMQLAFSNRFGSPERHVLTSFALPEHPDVFLISNLKENGKPKGAIRAGQYWHSDCSYLALPTMASMLHALQIPSVGGDTLFASLFAAYDALSAPMQRLLQGLNAVHDYSYAYETYFSRFPDRPPLSAQQRSSVPPVTHPLVRVHPDSGRRALFISPGFTRRIEGLSDDESRTLLQFLCAHVTRHDFVYRHQWQVGDVVIWDNRGALHCAMADYDMNEPRHLHRTSIAGDRPFGVTTAQSEAIR